MCLMSVVSADNSVNNTTDGSFNDFNLEVKNTSQVNLTKDYSYKDNDSSINLSKSIYINANNHSFNANNSSYIFQIDSNISVVFCEAYFKNYNSIFDNTSANITFINCNFSNKTTYNVFELYLRSYEDSIPNYCDEPSQYVTELAKAIVGNSKDIYAAKKLSIWIKQNIIHEGREGLYQNSDETLRRGVGNCLCMSVLFFEMCEALGLTKTHNLSFVHVGTMEFKYRHFFCLFDNICIDIDNRYSYPWGHVGNLLMPIFNVTKYPLLPIAKTY